jgi:hypothetical protein
MRFEENILHLEEKQKAAEQAEGMYVCNSGDFKCGQCQLCKDHILKNKKETYFQ